MQNSDSKQIFSKQKILLGAACAVCAAVLIYTVPLIFSDLFLHRGISLFEKGEPAGALKSFQAALFWDDDNPEIFRNIGDVYRARIHAEMEAFFRKNRSRKVIRVMPPVKLSDTDEETVYEEKVKVRQPSSSEIKKKIKSGAGDEERIQEHVVFVTPRFPGSGKDYEKKGITAYKAGILLNPSDARLYHGMAEIMQFGASVDDTEKVFRKAVTLDPNNPNIHYSFALFYLRKNMKASALGEMRKAVMIFPRESHRAFRSWIENGGTVGELPDVAGTSPSALYRLGLYFEKVKLPERAISAFTASCSAVGGNPDYREIQEDPPSNLLPHLLDRLERYGMKEEYGYYHGLWNRFLETYRNTG